MIAKIFSRLDFWRLAAPLVLSQASFQALQGLWFAPWLADVHGLTRAAAADYLFASALAYLVASVLLGSLTEMLAKRGVSQLRFYQAGMLLCAASFAPIALGAASGTLLWLVLFAATSIAAITAYTLLTQLVAAAQTGSVPTSRNVHLITQSIL